MMRADNQMAGMEGVEPPLTEPESAVLPLDDIPFDAGAPQRKHVLYGMLSACASPNFKEIALVDEMRTSNQSRIWVRCHGPMRLSLFDGSFSDGHTDWL